MPDISTALPNQVMEMVNSDALVPLNDSIKRIGQDKFNETALNEAKSEMITTLFLFIHMHKSCGLEQIC